jgi:hypothetical protein
MTARERPGRHPGGALLLRPGTGVLPGSNRPVMRLYAFKWGVDARVA